MNGTQGTAAELSASAPLHFFISRAGPDAAYAVKIAHILQDAGYRVFIQDRDIRNESIMAAMQAALTSGARTIALLSKDYLDPKRVHFAAEWQATIADDPLNRNRRLIVLRVGECAPPGLLKSLAYWDLVRVRDDALVANIVRGAVSPDAGRALPDAVAEYWKEARPIVHPEVRETPSFTGRGDAMADIDQPDYPDRSVAFGRTAAIVLRGCGEIVTATPARRARFFGSSKRRL